MIRQRSSPRHLCIHAGLPKTATTTLQLHLFSRHSQVDYLGTFKRDRTRRQYNKCRDAAIDEIFFRFVCKGKLRPNRDRCRRLVDQSMRFRFASLRQRRLMLGLRCDGLTPPGERARAPISDDWQKRILDHTRKGNRRLVEQWNLPLAQYGYPL